LQPGLLLGLLFGLRFLARRALAELLRLLRDLPVRQRFDKLLVRVVVFELGLAVRCGLGRFGRRSGLGRQLPLRGLELGLELVFFACQSVDAALEAAFRLRLLVLVAFLGFLLRLRGFRLLGGFGFRLGLLGFVRRRGRFWLAFGRQFPGLAPALVRQVVLGYHRFRCLWFVTHVDSIPGVQGPPVGRNCYVAGSACPFSFGINSGLNCWLSAAISCSWPAATACIPNWCAWSACCVRLCCSCSVSIISASCS